MGDRYLFRRLKDRFAHRGGLLVRFGDGDALPVALVPRTVWNTLKGKELIDHGLLAVRGNTLFYEGDRHRMEIPAASIQNVYSEPLSVDQFQTWTFVVVQVRAANGLDSLPFVRVVTPLFETLLRSKKRRSRVLLERLRPLVGEEEWVD